MSDTTHEAPKLLPCPFCGSLPDAGWFPGDYDICCDNCKFSISEHIVDYEGSEGQAKSAAVMRWNTRADLVQAAVAAALREAINRVNGCDRISEVQPAILALIREGGE